MSSRDGQPLVPGELPVRLATAAVLIPFALYIVWKGGGWLLAGCAVFAAAMAYEWVRMSCSPSMKLFGILSLVPFFVAPFTGPMAAFGVLVISAILCGASHPLSAKRFDQGFGLLYVSGLPLCLLFLREGSWDGAAAALIFMGIVWGSDSAAYFAGRGFGGPALHPDSPSKTWSGAIGAVIFSTLCGWLAARITGGDTLTWLIAGGLISVVAQLGDLFESSLKRRFGVKDASGLVPGHGGVMDRVDGLGMVCVVAVLVLTLFPDVRIALGLSA